VEFALVLPILLVLLLGVADFGRVFAAGISMEAATRNGAEAAAQEYVQIARNRGSLQPTDYEHLHEVAIWSVCHEASLLPSFVAVAGAPDAPPAPDGTIDVPCTSPVVAVCIHDAVGASFGPDPYCGFEATGAPAQCSQMSQTWSFTNAQGSGALPYVEVRTCYRFTTINPILASLRLPFGAGLSLGDVWLQRSRDFTVACYYAGCS
jgi:TadE-like protein